MFQHSIAGLQAAGAKAQVASLDASLQFCLNASRARLHFLTTPTMTETQEGESRSPKRGPKPGFKSIRSNKWNPVPVFFFPLPNAAPEMVADVPRTSRFAPGGFRELGARESPWHGSRTCTRGSSVLCGLQEHVISWSVCLLGWWVGWSRRLFSLCPACLCDCFCVCALCWFCFACSVLLCFACLFVLGR